MPRDAKEFVIEIEDDSRPVEVPFKYQGLRDAFFVFAMIAGKHGIDTPAKMNKILGIKTGKALYSGDILAHSWNDYIRFTAKIIFLRNNK